MNNLTMPQPCSQYWFVYTQSDGVPLLGTMFNKYKSDKIDYDMNCNIARVPYQQATVQPGKTQCIGKDHVRYFYKVDTINRVVVPNSMFQHVGKPKNMCTGRYSLREFLVQQPVV